MSLELNYLTQPKTSESFDFKFTLNDVIELAYRKIGSLADEESLSATQLDTARKYVNSILSTWSVANLFITAYDFVSVPFVASDIVEVDGLFYQCLVNHISDLNKKPSSGTESVSYWEEVETVTTNQWVENFTYKNISSPVIDNNIVEIEEARLVFADTGGFLPLPKMSREEFFNNLANNIVGRPSQYTFVRGAINSIQVWPLITDPITYRLEIMAYRYLEDFINIDKNPGIAKNFIQPLINTLAVELATSQGIFGTQLRDLERRAQESFEEAKSLNHQTGNIRIMPDLRFHSNFLSS